MSYSISVNGHKDTTSEDESVAFEQDVAAKARAFVATLEGVSNAQMSSGHLPPQNLMEEQ